MPGRIKRLMACALLGAATTVAVAWGLAAFPVRATRPMRMADAPKSGNGLLCGVARTDTFGRFTLAAALSDFEVHVPPGQRSELDEIVPRWARRELLEWTASATPELPTFAARGILAAGWPLPAMWASFDQQPAGGTAYWWFKARNGIVVEAAPAFPDFSGLSPHDRVLPLRVEPVGFLGCVVLWGAVWWMLLLVPGAARRKIRRRTGRCIECGYDREGLPAEALCPECGRVL